MATLDEARAAKARARLMWPDATIGLSGRDPDGYTVTVGLRAPLPDALSLPQDIDGVPVGFTTAHPARARMTADEFRTLESAHTPVGFGGAMDPITSRAITDALKDGERMRRMVESMATDYETAGHPCCPLCGWDEGHEDGCDFAALLEERRRLAELEREDTCQDR